MSTLQEQTLEAVVRMAAARWEGALLSATQPHPDTLHFVVKREALLGVAERLANQLQARFLISIGTDKRPLTGDFAILHIFSLDREHLYVLVEAPIPENDLRVDSITPVVPGADWAEREFQDAIGVRAEGHPDPRRLLLPDDWPEDVCPLRKDFPYNFRPRLVETGRPKMREAPAGSTILPMGPFFPVLEEPAYWRLFVEGETIVGCDTRLFYNHRGIEKLGESALAYNQVPQLAERICGICGFIHSTCYCQAVEKAAGIEAPRRARYIRTIMLELERIHSHLLWLGIAGHIIGFETVLMQTWRIREPVMWLCEAISGNRKTYGMNTVGGLARDFPNDLRRELLKTIADVEREAIAVRDAIVGDSVLRARTEGVGVSTKEEAQRVGVVGPPARASGVAIDARVDHPYAAYDEVPPRIVTQEAGDTWARVVVRVGELVESIRVVRQALAAVPDGPICTEIKGEIPEGKVGVSVVEAPRGEAVHFVMTGAGNRPYRWRVRAPTYANLQALPAAVMNGSIADVPITLGSLDPCFSCTERLEAIDRRTQAVRVYSRAGAAGDVQTAPGRGRMTHWLAVLMLFLLNVAIVLVLSPLYEGVLRKMRAAIHSRIGPPITQPYWDLFKLLGKEDLRSGGGWAYASLPALALGSLLLLATLVPMGTAAPLSFAGDMIAVLYVAAMSAVLVMLSALASGSPYASVGSSREMMMALSVEPVLAIALAVGAFKAGTLALDGMVDFQVRNGPSISMTIAGLAFFLALQAQSGKLPFDIAEADQEIMGGPLVEQSGPRLALLRWAMWAKQLVLAILLVEVFLPWPRFGILPADLAATAIKVMVVLLVVALVDVVNPRLRIDQAMGYFARVALASLSALAFAVIGK